MTDAPANPNQPLLDRQIAMLGELGDAALELALHLKARALVTDEPESLVTAFGRAARAVRLSLSLQAQLLKDTGDGPTAPETLHIQRIIVDPPERAGRDRPDRERETPDRILSVICKDLGLEPAVVEIIEDALARKQDLGELSGWPYADPHNRE
jgi:hypothetical protein